MCGNELPGQELTGYEATEEKEAAPEAVSSGDIQEDSLFPEASAKLELTQAMETLLFVAAEPLSSGKLAELIEVKPQEVEAAALELQSFYADRGLVLRRVAGGWQFVTAPRFSHLVEKLYRPKYQQLSAAAMETLAIIAYKQPITRAEVSEIRQLDSEGVHINKQLCMFAK